MVKRREQPTREQVESFANSADQTTQDGTLDPNAPRKFKAISVPFNEYEYQKLEEVAQKTGRTKLNTIRWAITRLYQELE